MSDNPRAKTVELEEKMNSILERFSKLEQFCKDLIKSLQYAEKQKSAQILLPEGEYFGIRID